MSGAVTPSSIPDGRSPLSYPAYRAMWLAGVGSFMGSFVQQVAEVWLMMDLTKSPLPVAMLSAAFMGASLVMMLPAGALADRYDRRKVVFASQIVQLVASLTMAVLAYTGRITPAALVAGQALLGLGMALGAPAWAALVPELVPRVLVAEAIALNSVAFNLARAVGPAVGGIVLARFGTVFSFVFNAVTFAGVMVAVYIYRSKEPRVVTPRRPLVQTFAEPWSHLRGDTDLIHVFIAMIVFTLGAGIFYVLAPAFGRETLKATPLAYGVMIGALGGGAVLGASIMKRLRSRVPPKVLIALTMLTFGTFSVAVSRAESVTAATVLLVPAGIGWLGSFSSLQALVQIWAPEPLRARVVAMYQLAHLATWAVAAVVAGFVADHLGIRTAMAAGAGVCALAALSTWRLGLPRSFSGGVITIPPPDPNDR